MKRRLLVALAWVLTLALVGGACFWAGKVVTKTPPTTATLAKHSMVTEVVNDSVGRTLTYNVTITQQRTPIATNLRTGVVTSINQADSYNQADTLYSVDSIPVRVVAGSTPFYRDLAVDAEGPDVHQLNQALADLGYIWTVTDRFTAVTETAVKRWQKALGMEQTGVVTKGELMAVPSLPQALFLDTKVLTLGALLTGSESIVSTASGEPAFTLDLTDEQAKQIPQEAAISISYKDHLWPAVITGSAPKEDAGSGLAITALTLAAPDGGLVCGEECAALPAQETLYTPATIEIIPSVSGPAVPVTALTSQPDGTTTVDLVTNAGTTRQAVTVKASVDGVAIVEGLTAGQKVQVYGSADTKNQSQKSQQPTSTGEPAGDARGSVEPSDAETGQ